MNLAEEIIKCLQNNNNNKQLYYNERFISAQEIIKQISSLADGLNSISFTNDNRILLVMRDSPELIYSFLALIKLGCIPITLNPYITKTELEYILEDSRAEGVIIDVESFNHLEKVILSSKYIKKQKIIINDINLNQQSKSLENKYLLSKVISFPLSDSHQYYYQKKAESIAFWQYTSGTSGKPKAVQHTQQSILVNTRLFAENKLKIDKTDSIISISKMFFGYGLGNTLFFPLITGASVLIDRESFSIDRNNKNISQFKPTIYFGVPKVYSEILHNKNELSQTDVSKVRIFFSSGSSLPELINILWKQKYGKYIVNGIGCTEIGHVFLCHDLDHTSPQISGRPVPGYEIKLICLSGSESEIEGSGTGELCVAPPLETLSVYWEKQVTNMIKYKQGWYHSGDIFYKTEDNDYIYQGRKDDLFKINGKWVNPNKIEHEVLLLFPQITECSLVESVNEDDLSISILFVVCFVSFCEKSQLEKEIPKKLLTKLHRYECPEKILFIDELPRNINGKIMRKELVKIFQNVDL